MTILDLKDKLYTSTEVANILGVSLRSVYRYLDENKLNADVKTATGRHRFSRQNILDFLYPDRSQEVQKEPSTAEAVRRPAVARKLVTSDAVESDDAVMNTKVSQAAPSGVNLLEEEQDVLEQAKGEDDTALETNDIPNTKEVEEEPVDWLARFRAAAEKYKTEQVAVKEDTTTPVRAPLHDRPVESAKVDTESVDSFIPKYEEVVIDEKGEYYYLSGVGSLKDIAQGLDKAAKKASLDYAFTMDAGLSLFKPIRPFSLIHSYIRPADREYFEKALKLTEVSKNSAQLCLIMSDDREVYESRKEMYGLNVVSKEKLKTDLINAGEKDLVDELENVA